MIKKIFVLSILVLILFCSLIKKDKSFTTISFATWGSKTETDILKTLISDYELEHPSIKIKLIHIPENYFQKLHLLFASKTAPDVLFINNLNIPFYAKAGVLKPFESYPSDIEPKALKSLSYNGKLYAIPRDISILTIYRNKDLFKKCKTGLNNEDWTFEEFLKTGKKLANCGVYGISFEEKPTLFYMPYMMSEGGGILSDDAKTNIFNTKESQTGLKFYADLRNKYHIAPTASESANLTMAQMFLQGKLAMHLSGHWLMPKYIQEAKFDWDTITFPNGKNGSVVSIDASGWAISNSSKHAKEAQDFIEFLAGKESITKLSQSGLIVPARKDVLNGEFSKDERNKAFIKAIASGKPTPVSEDYAELNDKINSVTEGIFNK